MYPEAAGLPVARPGSGGGPGRRGRGVPCHTARPLLVRVGPAHLSQMFVLRFGTGLVQRQLVLDAAGQGGGGRASFVPGDPSEAPRRWQVEQPGRQ